MMKKYQPVFESIYNTIRNQVVAGVKPSAIAVAIHNQYPSFIRFYDIPKGMQVEFLEAIAEQCWYDVYRNFDF